MGSWLEEVQPQPTSQPIYDRPTDQQHVNEITMAAFRPPSNNLYNFSTQCREQQSIGRTMLPPSLGNRRPSDGISPSQKGYIISGPARLEGTKKAPTIVHLGYLIYATKKSDGSYNKSSATSDGPFSSGSPEPFCRALYATRRSCGGPSGQNFDWLQSSPSESLPIVDCARGQIAGPHRSTIIQHRSPSSVEDASPRYKP